MRVTGEVIGVGVNGEAAAMAIIEAMASIGEGVPTVAEETISAVAITLGATMAARSTLTTSRLCRTLTARLSIHRTTVGGTTSTTGADTEVTTSIAMDSSSSEVVAASEETEGTTIIIVAGTKGTKRERKRLVPDLVWMTNQPQAPPTTTEQFSLCVRPLFSCTLSPDECVSRQIVYNL